MAEPKDQPVVSADVVAQRDAEIARRAMPGIWASLAMVQFVLLGGSYFHDQPGPTTLFVIFTMTATIVRLYLVLRKDEIYARSRRGWTIAFAGCLFVFSLAWGLMMGSTSINTGFASWNSMLLTFVALGISAGALVSFTPRIVFLYWHVLPMLGTCVVAFLYIGKEYNALAFIMSVYIAFLLIQGTHLHTDYCKAQQDRSQLEAAKKMAESANEAKSNFLANISHELRTPMNGIIGMTELALDTNLSAEQRDLLETARKSADSLLNLLTEVLDFSRIEAKRMELDQVRFDVRKLIRETVTSMAPVANEKRLKLTYEIAPRVPDEVLGDPARMRQVLTNLVGNAIKFTDAGSVEVRAGVDDITAEDACLHFTVKDTGIGVPLDKQDLIFRAFSQVDESMTRRHGGTGLGLTMCARLVEFMHGTIWLESAAGKGSTFHFTARLALPAPEFAAATESSLVVPR